MASTNPISSLMPPIAVQKPHKIAFGAVNGENRGETPFKETRYREDPWFWLRDDARNNVEMLDHLKKENAYVEEKTKHLVGFQKKLYEEHISHLKETDEDPPYPYGNYFYYTRTVKGLSYKIHCRKEASSFEELSKEETKEEMILDENSVAEGHKQCVIEAVKPSPDHTILGYSVDFTGNETYTVHLINLATGQELGDQVEGVGYGGGIQWGKDNTVFFYVTEDDAKRPYKLWKHLVGTKQCEDVCLFTEDDEVFNVNLGKSKDGRYLFVCSASTETYEFWYIDLHAEETKLHPIQKREKGLRYEVEHVSDKFLIWTNINNAVNNRLMCAPVDNPGKDNWKEIIPYDSTRKIDGVEVFRSFIAIEGRQDGLTQLWTMHMKNDTLDTIDPKILRKIDWPDEIFECSLSTNKVFETTLLRTRYSSLTTPVMWQDYDITKDSFSLVKQKEVLSFDSSLYVVKRMFAKANDGTKIPISMVHRKDTDINNGNTPTMLYGYGSYGICIDPGFNRFILPYLDRGMVYAIANIRGGGEMGRYWYEEEGKYLNKRNTFSDFINCAEHLIEMNITNPEKLAIEGRSAGGLLMGAVLNMRPDLFKVAIAGVPFVDVINSMCDPSIPLTTGEWEEWGNPNEARFFDYMLSYSPYDNVREQPYPNILITCGLHDPRVAYWEPAKWASKLRTLKTDKNDVLLKTELEAGHFSASDRYKYIREKSFEQSVVLDYLDLIDNDCK
jgi:oligopeptidase B